MDFATWKAEYQPRIYEDTGAHCYDHEEENYANPENWCDCEYLYTFDPSDEGEGQELELAHVEYRVWSWLGDGTIVSGMHEKADYLITEKPCYEDMKVI